MPQYGTEAQPELHVDGVCAVAGPDAVCSV
jgi:hypothetical protein